jgi:hypothetical protein
LTKSIQSSQKPIENLYGNNRMITIPLIDIRESGFTSLLDNHKHRAEALTEGETPVTNLYSQPASASSCGAL